MNNRVIDVHPDFAPQPLGEANDSRACMNRRNFLLTSGSSVAVVSLAGVSTVANAQAPKALRATYPRQKVASLSALKTGEPVNFNYPYPDVRNIVVKLGAPAGGAIGPQNDIVAFNQQCPHMGGPMDGTYKPEHQVLGPCPLHLTTFDLTRHGMVVSGHSTESLPQIVLELKGDDIFAVGVMGLVYGYSSNLAKA